LGKYKTGISCLLISLVSFVWTWSVIRDFEVESWLSLLIAALLGPLITFLASYRKENRIVFFLALPPTILRIIMTSIVSSCMDILLLNPCKHISISIVVVKEILTCEAKNSHFNTIRSIKIIQNELGSFFLREFEHYNILKHIAKFASSMTGLQDVQVPSKMSVDIELNLPSSINQSLFDSLLHVQESFQSVILLRGILTLFSNIITMFRVLHSSYKYNNKFPCLIMKHNLTCKVFILKICSNLWKPATATILLLSADFFSHEYSSQIIAEVNENLKQPIVVDYTQIINMTTILFDKNVLMQQNLTLANKILLDCSQLDARDDDKTYIIDIVLRCGILCVVVVAQEFRLKLREDFLKILQEIENIQNTE